MIFFKPSTPTAIIPTKGSERAAGFDFHADLGMGEELYLYPGVRKIIPTHIQVVLPINTYMRIAPRSGLAIKHGIDVMAGVIDEDYRGDIGVMLINHGEAKFKIAHGDRIAQGIVTQLFPAEVMGVLNINDELPATARGAGGFGSTGVGGGQ